MNVSFKGIADQFRLNSPLLINVIAPPLFENQSIAASNSTTSLLSPGNIDDIFVIHSDSNTLILMEQRHILTEEERSLSVPVSALNR